MTIQNDNLSPFERFQLETYGNILQDGKPVSLEEYENGSAERERDEERVNQYYEIQLLNQ